MGWLLANEGGLGRRRVKDGTKAEEGRDEVCTIEPHRPTGLHSRRQNLQHTATVCWGQVFKRMAGGRPTGS